MGGVSRDLVELIFAEFSRPTIHIRLRPHIRGNHRMAQGFVLGADGSESFTLTGNAQAFYRSRLNMHRAFLNDLETLFDHLIRIQLSAAVIGKYHIVFTVSHGKLLSVFVKYHSFAAASAYINSHVIHAQFP